MIQAVLRWLAAPGWMLAFFAFAALSAVVSMEFPDWITPVWGVPLAIFGVSLLAALLTNPRFRHDLPLLGMHLGLFAFILLVLFSRLTYFVGVTTLNRGETFAGAMQVAEQGPWYFGDLKALPFFFDGVEEVFKSGERWETTANRVGWRDAENRERRAVIGDHRPLVLNGFNIYTSRHRGFTVGFLWESDGGQAEVGSVQLRSGEYNQANEWVVGGQSLWAMLQPDVSLRLQPGDVRQNYGVREVPHTLVIRDGEQRHTLRRGERLRLSGGWLTYRSLDTWMGYRLIFDPAMPWMAAAGTLVVACMIWFYGRLFFAGRRSEQGGAV